MAIAFANIGVSANPDINDGANLNSYSNSSWIPPTDGIIIIFVQARVSGGTNPPTTPTISGNNLTWTQIGSTLQCGTDADARGNGISLFLADASGSTPGVTTIDFGGVTQVHCVASFFQATGVDISGGLAAAVVQQPTNNNNPTGTSISVALAAPGNSENRPIMCAWHREDEVTTPRANWTEVDDLIGIGQLRGVETQFRDDAFETTASASWTTSTNNAGMAAELKAVIVVTSDAVVAYASQVGIRKDEGVSEEALQGILKDDVWSLETVGTLIIDLSPNVETLISVVKDEGVSEEAGQGILKDQAPNLESLIGVLKDDVWSLETVGTLIIDLSPNVESLISVVKDVGVNEEAGQGVQQDRLPSLESLIGVLKDDVWSLETVGTLIIDLSPNVEARGLVTQNLSPNFESLVGLTSDEVEFFESLLGITKDVGANAEALQGTTIVVLANFESLITVVQLASNVQLSTFLIIPIILALTLALDEQSGQPGDVEQLDLTLSLDEE